MNHQFLEIAIDLANIINWISCWLSNRHRKKRRDKNMFTNDSAQDAVEALSNIIDGFCSNNVQQ